jgi:hypothetical protein
MLNPSALAVRMLSTNSNFLWAARLEDRQGLAPCKDLVHEARGPTIRSRKLAP